MNHRNDFTSEAYEGDEERGLYQKYIVQRTDGSSAPGGKHEQCDVFVLDLTHDRHAIAALEMYAESCADEFPNNLYDDLNDKLAKLSPHRSCTPPREPGQTVDLQCSAPAVVPLGNGCWFCVEHAVDFHERCAALGPRAQETLLRRGVTLGLGRAIEPRRMMRDP